MAAKANFNAYHNYAIDSLHQWDLNQVLTLRGLNLATAPEVHFSNKNMARAIVRQATMENHVVTVNIPNSLLQDPLRIYAHIGIYEGSTFTVVETVEIPVIPRTRPLDYQIEDNDGEVYSFKALENALKNKADSARVDNIIAHNNDTEGNTELVDIRVGVGGKTYASAGAAIREQFEGLQYGVNNNSMVLGALIPGEYVDNNDGAIKEMASYERTDYLDISGMTVLTVKAPATLSFCALYDSGKSFIQQITLSAGAAEYTLPDGAAYIMLSAATGLLAETVVKSKLWADVQKNAAVFDALEYAKQGQETLAAVFTVGTMLNGVIDPSVIYRVATRDIVTYDRDIILKVHDAACQFGVAFYSAGAFVSQTGWITSAGEKYIPAGTQFRVVVSPVAAVWEKADIALLSSKLRIDTVQAERYNQLKHDAVKKALFFPKRARFIAHRGLSAEAPENTLAAFEKAGQAGAFAIETDVYITTDGRFVLAHDDDISAYTNAPTGTTITGSTFAKVRSYPVTKGANAAQHDGQLIPTLEEYLEICNAYGCAPMIEIKNIQGKYDQLVGVVNAYGYHEDAVYINYAVHYPLIRQAVGDCMVTINLEGSDSYANQVDVLKAAGAYNIIVAVSPDIAGVTAELIKKCHASGYLVNVWTINDVETAATYYRMGADMVTSDALTALQ